MSTPFSPIMTVAALVFPPTILGMMDASITRRFFVPITFKLESTTAMESFKEPILHVPTG